VRKVVPYNILLSLALVLAGPFIAWADVLQQIGTIGNESNWRVSLNGMTWYVPYQAIAPPAESAIGIQNELRGTNDLGDPQPAIGGSDLSTWNGMWVAKCTFFIPMCASDIHFHLNSVLVDDKASIFLESFPVGYFSLNQTDALGSFQFADNPGNVVNYVNYVSGQNVPPWWWDKELHPGLNTIEVYLDNTDDSSLWALSETNAGGSRLYTYLNLDATVTYTPEPGTWALLLTMGGIISAKLLRKHR